MAFQLLRNFMVKGPIIIKPTMTAGIYQKMLKSTYLPLILVNQQNFNCFLQKSRQYSKPVKYQQEGQVLSSESESDSDLETLGHRGESEFWRRKLRTFHSILDVNKDGVLSFDDFKLLSERFINLGHLSDKHIDEFRNLLKELWEKRWGEIHQYNVVTVEQYLNDMHHVLNDKRLVRHAHSFLPYLFRAVDKDKSGTIQVEEFKLFFKCLGLNEHDAVLAFHAIDSNNDGKLTMKEFVKHGREFFLTEDEECISKYFFGPLQK